MKVILFGATGMVGQGVLRECLLDGRVESVLTIGRSITGQRHPKLREIEHKDLLDLTSIEPRLAAYDACFFCLGSFSIHEEEYRRVAYDIAMAVARAVVKENPTLVFIYMSGAGADRTEKGRILWTRIKGKAENALLRLPFKAVYMFRPVLIQSLHGKKAKTKLYRAFYALATPVLPVLKTLFPKYVITTEQVGRAMINAVARGFPKTALESRDIIQLAE